MSDFLSSKFCTHLKVMLIVNMLNFQAQLPTPAQLQQHLHLDLVQRVILILENVHKMLFKKHSGDLKDLLSKSEATFRGIAGACREVKIINSFEYDEIFDGMTRQTLAERVDQFIRRDNLCS